MPAALDETALRRAMTLYAEALRRHRDELDSLNVYPVPDGDTGTNMLRTQEAVVAALGSPLDGSALGSTVAHASLMGARGNSGVILSQVLRGFFDGLGDGPAEGADANATAGALRAAAESAYRAVAEPADGTVLSVLRDAAREAMRAAPGSVDPVRVLDAAVDEALAALDRTRDLLPALRDAGVVDAGGKGIVLLLDALRAAAAGSEPVERPQSFGPARHSSAAEPSRSGAGVGRSSLANPYEVQYLLEVDDRAMPPLRERLAALGDSLAVVGGDGLFNVHVHTPTPGRAIEAALDVGRPRDISVTWLEGQVAECLGDHARGVRFGGPHREEAGAAGLVAVADGNGLAETFRSLGAAVVPGGPGNNPSVADLLAAIRAEPAPEVVVLPNHPNVGPAAERAAEQSPKPVVVVPTRSIPEGIAAATAFSPESTMERNAPAMREAVGACRSGALARAEREAITPAGSVGRGDWIGVAGDEVAEIGGTAPEIAVRLARRLVTDDAEILTVIVGADAQAEDRSMVVEALRAALPELEVQVLDGGQPLYPFLIGVE